MNFEEDAIYNSKILIVDDQPLSIKLMEALLKQQGFATTSVSSGQEALDYLKDETNIPDLIMLDVMMPGMSGFEVAKQLKSNAATSEIPIIFVTARDDAETINSCFTSGGSDYAAKPLRIYELLARVKLLLTAKMHKEKFTDLTKIYDETQTFLTKIIDSNPAHIFVIRKDNRWVLVNDAFATFHGIPSKEIQGEEEARWQHSRVFRTSASGDRF